MQGKPECFWDVLSLLAQAIQWLPTWLLTSSKTGLFGYLNNLHAISLNCEYHSRYKIQGIKFKTRAVANEHLEMQTGGLFVLSSYVLFECIRVDNYTTELKA